MAIAERIRQARRMSGLTLSQVGARAGVTAQAISKYEHGLDVPGSGVLIRLSKALGVRVEFFLRPVGVGRIRLVAPERTHLSQKSQAALVATIREWLERYLAIETLLTEDQQASALHFALPNGFPSPICSLEDVEQVANALRRAWDLGLDPIENLMELLEDKGIKVGLVEVAGSFDAGTLEAEMEGQVLVFAVTKGLPGDLQRFALARQMGYSLLQPQPPLDGEKVVHRFAWAFLAPETAVRSELSNRRRKLDLYSLHMLKHRYGLSMQAWAHRAKELGILSPSGAQSFFRTFKQNDWHRVEPGDPYPPEEPGRMARLVMQALSEEVISETRAAELLGRPLREFFEKVAQDHGGLPVAVSSLYSESSRRYT